MRSIQVAYTLNPYKVFDFSGPIKDPIVGGAWGLGLASWRLEN